MRLCGALCNAQYCALRRFGGCLLLFAREIRGERG
jgi:hypothetical protein